MEFLLLFVGGPVKMALSGAKDTVMPPLPVVTGSSALRVRFQPVSSAMAANQRLGGHLPEPTKGYSWKLPFPSASTVPM